MNVYKKPHNGVFLRQIRKPERTLKINMIKLRIISGLVTIVLLKHNSYIISGVMYRGIVQVLQRKSYKVSKVRKQHKDFIIFCIILHKSLSQVPKNLKIFIDKFR